MCDVIIVSLAPVMPVFDFYIVFVELFVALAIAAFSIAFSVWIICELIRRKRKEDL